MDTENNNLEQASEDEIKGIEWWNYASVSERTYYLGQTDNYTAAEAWQVRKAELGFENNKLSHRRIKPGLKQ